MRDWKLKMRKSHWRAIHGTRTNANRGGILKVRRPKPRRGQ